MQVVGTDTIILHVSHHKQQWKTLTNHAPMKEHEVSLGAGVLPSMLQRKNVKRTIGVDHFDGSDPSLPVATVHRDDEADLMIEELDT
jgi:hypothetical protein